MPDGTGNNWFARCEIDEKKRTLQKTRVESGVSAHTFQSMIGPHMTFVGFETGSAVMTIAAMQVIQTLEMKSFL